MSRFFIRLFSILTLTFLLSPAAYSEPINFAFDPPLVEYTTTREVSTTSILDGSINMQFSFVVVSDNTLIRKEAGYELVVEPKSVEVFEGGQLSDNPFLRVLKSTPYRLQINPVGEATEVVGFTDFNERLDAELSEAMAARARQRLDVKQIRQEIVSEWNGLVGFRRQGAAEIGEIVYDQKRSREQDGSSTTIYSASVITDTMSIDGQTCATMRITACSDPVRLADSLGLTRTKVMEVFALTDQRVGEAQKAAVDMVSIAELTYEIKTGLVRSLTTSMAMIRQMTSGGATGTATVSEVESVVYDYTSRKSDS